MIDHQLLRLAIEATHYDIAHRQLQTILDKPQDKFDDETPSDCCVHRFLPDPGEIICACLALEAVPPRYFAFCPLTVLVLCAPFVT